MTTIQESLKQIETNSKQSRNIYFGLLLLALLISVVWFLYSMKSIEAVEVEKDMVIQEYFELREGVSSISKYLSSKELGEKEIEKIIEELPIENFIRPQSVSIKTGENLSKNNNLPARNFYIYLDMDNEIKNKIDSVTYFFDHPSFYDNKYMTTSNLSERFKVQYFGWGCMSEVQIQLFSKTGKVDTINYEMCNYLLEFEENRFPLKNKKNEPNRVPTDKSKI